MKYYEIILFAALLFSSNLFVQYGSPLNESIKRYITRDHSMNKESENDSIIQLRRKEFLTPKFIGANIGTSFVTKERLEKDLDIYVERYRNGVTYYELDIPIGLRYMGKLEVCVELSFRLFGEDGPEYENSLVKSGFILKSKKKTKNLELNGDMSSQLLNGEYRTYRKGEVVCEVMEGSYFGFSFYRTQLPTKHKLQSIKTSSKSLHHRIKNKQASK
jgi:hypothetical protein